MEEKVILEEIESKTFEFNDGERVRKLIPVISYVEGKVLCFNLYEVNTLEEFDRLTQNLWDEGTIKDNDMIGYINAPYLPDYVDFIREHHFGEMTGHFILFENNIYPECEFYKDMNVMYSVFKEYKEIKEKNNQ